ncbi:MAG: HupE/UreJ family protein [Acidimicrobiales bacterium]
MTNSTVRTALLAVGGALGGVLLVAAPAAAHTGHPVTGAGDGFWHPITGIDHLLAMVAVGIVAATTARGRSVWLAPAAFVGGMALGGTAGMVGLPLPGAEIAIAASVLLLGIAIAAAVELRGRHLAPLLGLLAVAGFAHGHAHGAEAPTSVHPVAYVAGFLVATVLLHVAGVGVGTVIRDRRTVRLGVGAAAVAAGALLLV